MAKIVSLPVRGAWIEIVVGGVCANADASLPVRGAWIEMEIPVILAMSAMSLPVRGAWIEIITASVAPRAGSVD